MPRISRILSAARQPADIRIRASGHSRGLTSTQRVSAEKVLAGVLNSALDGVALLRAIRNAAGRIVDFRWIRINPEGEKILGNWLRSLQEG